MKLMKMDTMLSILSLEKYLAYLTGNKEQNRTAYRFYRIWLHIWIKTIHAFSNPLCNDDQYITFKPDWTDKLSYMQT